MNDEAYKVIRLVGGKRYSTSINIESKYCVEYPLPIETIKAKKNSIGFLLFSHFGYAEHFMNMMMNTKWLNREKEAVWFRFSIIKVKCLSKISIPEKISSPTFLDTFYDKSTKAEITMKPFLGSICCHKITILE